MDKLLSIIEQCTVINTFYNIDLLILSSTGRVLRDQ